MADFVTHNPATAAGVISTGSVVESAPSGTSRLKVYLGGSWISKPIKVFLGGSWVEKTLKYHNGSAWD